MSFANDVVFIACNGVRKKTTYNKDREPASLLRPETVPGHATRRHGTTVFRTNTGDNKETEQEAGTMKAIVVTDQAAGTAGMTLVERPEPQAAINDVVVQVHASGFVPTELTWPSTWTDLLDRDRT